MKPISLNFAYKVLIFHDEEMRTMIYRRMTTVGTEGLYYGKPNAQELIIKMMARQ